jgi:hypothetical protein
MYVDSIICNAGVLMVQGTLSEAFKPAALAAMVRYIIMSSNNLKPFDLVCVRVGLGPESK